MKISQLLNFSIPLTNEEKEFVDSHSNKISIASLLDRDQVLARNLVRKGIYEISNDNKYLEKIDEKNS